MTISRRDFLQNAAVGAAILSIPTVLIAAPPKTITVMNIAAMVRGDVYEREALSKGIQSKDRFGVWQDYREVRRYVSFTSKEFRDEVNIPWVDEYTLRDAVVCLGKDENFVTWEPREVKEVPLHKIETFKAAFQRFLDKELLAVLV